MAVTLKEQKLALRAHSMERRAAAASDKSAADVVARRFFRHVPLASASVLSVYWPMRSELDSRPLMDRAREAGHTIALPVVSERGGVLTFRVWTLDLELIDGPFGTSEPPVTAPGAWPHVMVLPLLAFDGAGHRLGYGGGYYDRTVRAFRRAEPAPLVVGIAYASQEVESVPRDLGDETLDWVVTEREARRFP